MMEIEYDEQADALYIRFTHKPFHHMESLDDRRHIDYAEDGTVIGIEVLASSEGVSLHDLPEQTTVGQLLTQYKFKVHA